MLQLSDSFLYCCIPSHLRGGRLLFELPPPEMYSITCSSVSVKSVQITRISHFENTCNVYTKSKCACSRYVERSNNSNGDRCVLYARFCGYVPCFCHFLVTKAFPCILFLNPTIFNFFWHDVVLVILRHGLAITRNMAT